MVAGPIFTSPTIFIFNVDINTGTLIWRVKFGYFGSDPGDRVKTPNMNLYVNAGILYIAYHTGSYVLNKGFLVVFNIGS